MRRMTGMALLAALAACGRGGGSVEGRWQRVGQPREWVRFAGDGTFTGQGYMEPQTLRGRYTQHGDSVTATSAQGYTRTFTVGDTVLVMDDGTRFRRVR